MGPDPREARLLALAGRQHRTITRAQLLALGLGPSAIAYRAQHGRLHRVHPSVYTVGPPPGTPLERAAAAVLACGPGAALSHTSALTLWALQKGWPGPLHVTTPSDHRRPGIVVHVSGTLRRTDVRTQLGIRATSPARTILDCAPELGSRRTARVIDDGRLAGLLRVRELRELLVRLPRHPGRSVLGPLIATDDGPTRSHFETDFLAFCRRFGLPRPQVNVHVCGYEADALFGAQRVVVELDSWRFHQGRPRFESDRERDAVRLTAGYVTYRLTWWRLEHAPEREARRLQAVLAGRRG
ncbi:MAG: type IV toxin-antitoxin system AbiEi family antitoxin domain-containing protein [Actinomycetota bacterium]|nr:type IV toxin-antitoxin system AbiEi family antitoxin domain-containing protein [Actinomycetota bacterium]